jgi:hypothetical protein
MTDKGDYVLLLGAILDLFSIFVGFAVCGGLAATMWGV